MTIKEQSKLSDKDIKALNLSDVYTPMPNEKLQLNRDSDGNWWSSYIIGISDINGQSFEVLPKVKNLDFMSLFSFALMYQPSSEYFSKCYDINWDKETVASTELYNVLTPLLVMQYLNILSKLIGKGLKKDYIICENNIHSKIRGKVKTIAHFRNNILKKKDDYFYCQYQIFTSDIPVNRLLKKALDISFLLLGNIRSRSQNMTGLAFLSSKIKFLEIFKDISCDVRPESVRSFKYDKLNIYYPDAIRLAKSIIRHQDNALIGDCGKMKVPYFWIDMSRLFEVYVLGLLQTRYPNQILFQEKGSYDTQCDYLHIGEGIIIDAKYKKWYSTEKDRSNPNHKKDMIADIREISAYARDERFLSLFKKDVCTPICIIIYPDEVPTELKDELSKSVENNKIASYRDFYLLGVDLPRL